MHMYTQTQTQTHTQTHLNILKKAFLVVSHRLQSHQNLAPHFTHHFAVVIFVLNAKSNNLVLAMKMVKQHYFSF
jgi:hypothetical protein